MLKDLGRNERILLSIVGIVGILFLYYTFIFKPTFTLINNKRANITAYNKEINRIEGIKKANIKLAADIKTLQSKSDEDLKHLPFSARIPEVARDIKPLVENNGMPFGTVSFGKPMDYAVSTGADTATNANALKLMSFPVVFSTSGDYPAIMKLIDVMESNDRIIGIDNVSFAPSKTNIQANFSIRYYFVTTTKEDTVLDYNFNKGVYGKDNLFK